jgi:predicted DCC family thiol-disulfide oxidoreductase YuxK
MTASMANTPAILGSVYYDANCPSCVRITTLLRRALRSRGYTLVPLQTPDAATRLKVRPEELFTEMRMLDRSGRVLGGAEAIVEIAHHIWWAQPVAWAAKLPCFMRALHVLYADHARHRHCASGSCAHRKRHAARRVFFEMP